MVALGVAAEDDQGVVIADSMGPQKIEAQVRDCFGRVAYSHKTHEKCADILESRFALIKNSQLVLSAGTTAGLLAVLFGQGTAFAVSSAVTSFVLLVLNAYLRQYDLGKLAEEHRATASDLWRIREGYLSLLTDLRVADLPITELRARRDYLLNELASVYAAAPSTWSKAYNKAQTALQQQGELTFDEAEIDLLLPAALRKAEVS